MNMSYRRLDSNGDYIFGGGRSMYLRGADAVAQAIRTRLLLLKNEWWEDQLDGLPLWQQILGQNNGGKKNIVDGLIQARIMDWPPVLSISSVSSTYDPDTRAYSFSAVADTVFGQIVINGGA